MSEDGFGFDQAARDRAAIQKEQEDRRSLETPALLPPFPYPAGPRFDPEFFRIPVRVPTDERD